MTFRALFNSFSCIIDGNDDHLSFADLVSINQANFIDKVSRSVNVRMGKRNRSLD